MAEVEVCVVLNPSGPNPQRATETKPSELRNQDFYSSPFYSEVLKLDTQTDTSFPHIISNPENQLQSDGVDAERKQSIEWVLYLVR
jgi:hypothetical protein